MTKTLIIMRHAKSCWTTGDADFHRPLAGRGRRDAAAAARFLLAADLVPDLVLCSAATRARQTWDLLAAGGVEPGEVTYREDMYHAYAEDLLAILRQVPAEAGKVLLIGHQPTLGDLIFDLSAGDSLGGQMSAGFPTSAIAVLNVTGEWADLDDNSAELVRLEIPRS